MPLRLKGIKGSSSRVFLAILYTSILWFALDVLFLVMYSSLSEDNDRSTHKLPTNDGHQRNARGEEPLYALSGEAALDSQLRKDIVRHAIKTPSDAERMLGAREGQGQRKPSRFSWGKDLKNKLLHSNTSKEHLQLSKDDKVGDSLEKKLLEVRGEMLKEIESLKKELDQARKHEKGSSEKVQNERSSKNELKPNDIRPKSDQNTSIDNKRNTQKDTEKSREENNVAQNKLVSTAKPGKHLVRNIDVTSKPRDPYGPGENGIGVKTKPEEKEKVKIGWEHAYFNEYVSDMISVERSLPDVRPDLCKTKEYSNDLPKTSVIICFTEESWSTLLRTVHSVLNRSPPELIAEVLLVDDFSQREYLKEPLDKYMKRFPKVKIVRLGQREGLIRARIIGAEMAEGPVLTFLDSHVECNVGWLEPLLQRIHDDKTNVVCPSIDAIDETTFGYSDSGQGIIGAFNWEMRFIWNAMPDYEARRREDQSWPIRSPAMAGGLFSIDKSFFYNIGTYDPGFDIWGAENLELSFKIWMCGGTLEIHPCSRVAHIFRKKQPYKFPGGNLKTYKRNTMRLVEVWVDEPYKQIFYSNRPELIGQEYGDVSDRITLRKDLQCHDFKWYLDNVFPALRIPDTNVRARGEVKNALTLMCLDSMGKGVLGMFPCHGEGNNQHFTLTWDDALEHKGQCLTKTPFPGRVRMANCQKTSSLHLVHTKGGTIQDSGTGKCLDVSTDHTMAVFNHCTGTLAQKWSFSRYYNRKGHALP
ncbi:polypeptide N-acetylgalactosaminyltransferase 1-like [Lytechinus variegatus]|uniref:polypeptide N-acetylgalactosaminyltransferase 1-like n=1 Tax=Lytechinus variegatus TaxID=7654 RepID=UPI001BB25304|nr:polypeptide N-acetylgalactosaminyltransferase 1-like [Lytechinus variegatus]